MTTPADLVSLLRCPDCRSPFALENEWLVCDGEASHRFPVVDGVPVLLGDAALEEDAQYGRQLEYFDAQFSRYQDYRLDRWRESYLERLRDVRALGGPGAPLIDVGVGGSGYTVIEAAKEGRAAIGCDLSLTGLRVARRFAAGEGVADSTLFVCCSAESLPFASDSFDVALAIAVIEHVPDDQAALSEMARLLRPSGRAWITVPHDLRHFSPLFWYPNVAHDQRLGHLRRYSAGPLEERCRQLGLVADDVQWTGHTIKALQIVFADRLRGRLADRFWWWCEKRDLARARQRCGSMQLSLAFHRA